MNIKNIRRKLRPVKKIFIKLIFLLSKLIFFFIPNFILDNSLERRVYCRHKNIKFSIRDFSKICRFRAKTFSIKEPDTLEWIDNFDEESLLIDIGANLGIYSIYASNKVKKIYAFEPDALNFALLNLNILDNNKEKIINAFPISIHSKETYNFLNIQKYIWGGALSSFENKFDQFQKEFKPEIEQGSYSMTLDQVINNLEIKNKKINCKIDVDGNEIEILKGASNTLKEKIFNSVLIELDTNRTDYNNTLKYFENNGYILRSINSSPVLKDIFGSTKNHIFYAK